MHSHVSLIIVDKSRKMRALKNDSVILEGVICGGRYKAGLSVCPRSNYPYWREIWLERVDPSEISAESMASAACSASGLSAQCLRLSRISSTIRRDY